jgi:hypothetical protein
MLVNDIGVATGGIEGASHIQSFLKLGPIQSLPQKEKAVKNGRLPCVVTAEDYGQRAYRDFAAVKKAAKIAEAKAGYRHELEPLLPARRLALRSPHSSRTTQIKRQF